MMTDPETALAYTTRLLTGETWDDFAALVEAGGGVVEADPEQVEGRPPQQGSYSHTGPETLYATFGFQRGRRIATWRWVTRLRVEP